MSDKDKIKMMEDLNWKSAAQYWKEQAEKLEKLEERLQVYEKLEKKLIGLYPEHADQPFICSYDKKGSPPEYLVVCPAYGSDHVYKYTVESIHTQQGG